MLHTLAINSLASRSLVLRQAYCQYPSCGPSRMSLFTGRRPERKQGYSNDKRYRRKDIRGNMFEYYKKHGYYTLAIGKSLHYLKGSFWLNEDTDMWSEPPVIPRGRSSDPYWKSYFQNMWMSVSATQRANHPLPDNVILSQSIKRLHQLSTTQCEQPFFLAVGFGLPHTPIIFPDDFLKYYPLSTVTGLQYPNRSESRPNISVGPKQALMCRMHVLKGNGPDPTRQCVKDKMDKALSYRRAYFAAVSYIDSLLGELLEELSALRLEGNTIVIFTSDHGYMLGEHGLWQKNMLLDEATRVPLMLHVPGLTNHGSVSERLVELVDIFPSIVDATGLPPVKQCSETSSSSEIPCHEGLSLLPLIQHPNRAWKTAVFSQATKKDLVVQSVQTVTSRYTEHVNMTRLQLGQNRRYVQGRELYDHSTDPTEGNNIVDASQAQSTVEAMRAILYARWKAALPHANVKSSGKGT